jgi:subtilisin family serine protease
VGASSPTDEHKSASSSDGEFGWGSSYVGPGPDICAPGPWSYSTDRLGKKGYNDGSSLRDADYEPVFTGTSSATPKVAGIVALMLSANPSLTPSQVKGILRKTADDIDRPGVDDKTGAGRVNALKAVRSALDNR